MLIELPNGAHVDPTTITAILPLEADQYGNGHRVAVHHGRDQASISLIQFVSDAKAREWARVLAMMCNEPAASATEAQAPEESWRDRGPLT